MYIYIYRIHLSFPTEEIIGHLGNCLLSRGQNQGPSQGVAGANVQELDAWAIFKLGILP